MMMSVEPIQDSPSKGHVLVVDDDNDIRALLRDFLEYEGYAIHEARDGQVALDWLRQTTERWVVLTDHFMPRLNGPGLMTAVLADRQLYARHAFIYMTAADQAIEPNLQALLKTLHAPILRKPFSFDICLETVAPAAERLAAATA